MSNFDLAVEAVTYARQIIPPNTSDNKKFESTVKWDDTTVPLAKREMAVMASMEHGFKAQRVAELRANKLFPPNSDKSIKGCQKYGEVVQSRAIGNCLEYSCVIAQFLKKKKADFDLVTFEGGDHVFVAIGQPAPTAGKYPTNFATWDKDSAIADAWADIGCLASQYPAMWRARMANWSNIHLMLAKVGGGFIMPSDAYWTDAVDNPKVSYTQPV